MTFCGQCGYNNPEERTECINCGAQLHLGIRREAMEVERIASFDQNKQYPAPVASQQPPAPGFVPMPPAPSVAPVQQVQQVPEQQQQESGMGIEEDEPVATYDPSGRRFAIILSVSALAITLVALFALPMDFNSFDNTLLRVGLMDGETTVMALVIVTLVISLVSLIMPLFNVLSGILLIVASFMAYNDMTALFSQLSSPGFIVFILLAVYVIILGVVSTIFMKRFIDNNVGGVPLFRACYLTWTGIPHN